MAKESAPKKKIARPTALKRDIQSEKRRLQNKAFKSKMKTAIRRFHESLKADNNDTVRETLNCAYSLLDKAVKRNVLKLNAASRHKSRLAARVAAKA